LQILTSSSPTIGFGDDGTLCSTLRECAAETWILLETATRIGIDVGEETVTDLNLVRIQARHPNDVFIRKFNRVVEGNHTGADWMWWLGVPSSGKWICLRVQAKKLDIESSRYKKINYPGKTAAQLQMLIQDAQLNSAIPMYCFYNYWPTGRRPPRWNCGTYPAAQVELQGCMLSSAEAIRGLKRNDRSDSLTVSVRSLPWHCLVCCQGYARPNADLVDRAIGVLTRSFEIMASTIVVHPSPPGYVQKMMLGGRRDASSSTGLPEELPSELSPGISYVMVTTEAARLG